MTPMECHASMKDLCAHYGLGADAAAAWGSVVYKGCVKMKSEYFKVVCDELLTMAGKWKPTNEEFWEKFKELKAQNGWERGEKCSSCGGENGYHKAIGGTWIVKADWREMKELDDYYTFQANSTPCALDASEGARKWRESLNVARAKGWIEVPMGAYRLEMQAFREEKKRREAIPVEVKP